MSSEEAILLEENAFRAWPAAEVIDLDGWRLRATSGVTRRANSAWTIQAAGSLTLERRIEQTESFYRARGLPAIIQVSPSSQPPELDAVLASRGYVVDAPVSIQTNTISALVHLSEIDACRCVVEDRYGPDWLHVSVDRGRFARVGNIYRGLLDRLGTRAGFAIARSSGVPVAIGLAVLDGDWVGLFNMLTVPEHRRRGAARQVLGALAQWATRRGARRAYLQVERTSGPAVSLYASVGFREEYGYHYRIPKR